MGSGNLYGTTVEAANYGPGLVFKLSPSPGGWTFSDLHDFGNTDYPSGSLVLDRNGNLYGTADGGAYNNGDVFQVTP